jgi:hypothetical protein
VVDADWEVAEKKPKGKRKGKGPKKGKKKEPEPAMDWEDEGDAEEAIDWEETEPRAPSPEPPKEEKVKDIAWGDEDEEDEEDWW